MHGRVVLFGSGEMSPYGKTLFRKALFDLPRKQEVVILETPAGFQPNSQQTAEEIAEIFRFSLSEFFSKLSIIPARKKGSIESPDNLEILQPLDTATFIFLGPGSPTYAQKQLEDSQAFAKMKQRWQDGATLCLSSAAAIAFGSFVLPVYEIYKAGFELYWVKGLDVLSEIGVHAAIIPHWNNTDGGTNLDTSHCFMGKKRFDELVSLLPTNQLYIGIDENTLLILDLVSKSCQVEGKGQVTLRFLSTEKYLLREQTYPISLLQNPSELLRLG